jgi:hypothetical protein
MTNALLTRTTQGESLEVALLNGGSAILIPTEVSPIAFALSYAQFFGISSTFGLPDYPNPIAAGANVPFPEVGPSLGPNPVTALSTSTFQLPGAGTYRVVFQLPITEANAELGVGIDGALFGSPVCVAGREAAGAQIWGNFVFTVNAPHVLSIMNPASAPSSLTVTPKAGGGNAVSATLLIEQIG